METGLFLDNSTAQCVSCTEGCGTCTQAPDICDSCEPQAAPVWVKAVGPFAVRGVPGGALCSATLTGCPLPTRQPPSPQPAKLTGAGPGRSPCHTPQATRATPT